MEQSSLQEILKALELHFETIDKKMDEKLGRMQSGLENRMDDMKLGLENRMDNMKSELENRMDKMQSGLENRMDEGFKQVDTRFNRLEKKVDGIRVELTETQETVDYLSSKNVQHEKKLRSINEYSL